jgi:hypothetical protein
MGDKMRMRFLVIGMGVAALLVAALAYKRTDHVTVGEWQVIENEPDVSKGKEGR